MVMVSVKVEIYLVAVVMENIFKTYETSFYSYNEINICYFTFQKYKKFPIKLKYKALQI